MKKLQILSFALVSIFVVQSAKAWNGAGHSSIAYVAEQHLTSEAKEKCRYYLRHNLAYYASWMDYWRNMEMFRKVNSGHTVAATKNGKGLVVKRRAMKHLVNTLAELGDGKYKNLPDSIVRQRLINMIHYVGDMHCPSHVAFSKKNFSQYKGRADVYRGKRKVAYHSFWDSSPAMGRKGWTIEDYAKDIDKASKRQINAWQSGSLTDWGRDIAKGGHRGQQLYPEGKDLSKLSKKELKDIKALTNEMSMQGAYRLAHVLNTIFADGNVPVK